MTAGEGGMITTADDALAERIVSLPLFPRMAEQDVRDVAGAVSGLVQRFSKGEEKGPMPARAGSPLLAS